MRSIVSRQHTLGQSGRANARSHFVAVGNYMMRWIAENNPRPIQSLAADQNKLQEMARAQEHDGGQNGIHFSTRHKASEWPQHGAKAAFSSGIGNLTAGKVSKNQVAAGKQSQMG